MPSFPTSVFSPTTKSAGQTIQSAHVNDLQDEVVAIESGYINGTAPLNSSNASVTNLSVTGGSTLGSVAFSTGATFNGAVTVSSGGLTVSTGALTINQGQIVFPATQVPAAGANTLDDYEEGTWTPVITAETPGNLSVTYDSQIGNYTKIGRMVNVQFLLDTATFTHTSASGNLILTGLPFAAAAIEFTGSAMFHNWTKANYTWAVSKILASASQIIFHAGASGQSFSNVAITEFATANDTKIFGSITYYST